MRLSKIEDAGASAGTPVSVVDPRLTRALLRTQAI